MSLFRLFKSKAKLQEETEFVRVYCVSTGDKEFKVVVTKRRANGHTVIHCEHNHIAWEQVPLFPRFSGRNYGDKVSIYAAIPDKSCVTLFVVRGKPNGFVGLDDGVFRCADNRNDCCINVMSYSRFQRL